MWRLLLLAGTAGLLCGCSARPYRVFAVQVAHAPSVNPAPSGTEPAATAITLGKARKSAAAPRRARKSRYGKVQAWDPNTASARQLAQLPGISAVLVRAIVAGRPYRGKRELLQRKIFTEAQYARWKSYLVVHRGDAATPARRPRAN